jgi:DNA-binding transcriptional LysR family regulator
VAGLLSIGLPPSLSRTLTGPLVEAFRARFPRATLTMVEGLSNYTLEWLEQGRIDCAVVYNATPSAAVDLQPVLDEQLFLVSSRGPCRPRGRTAPGHAGRRGGARTGHPQPPARHPHAAGNRAGPGRPEAPRGPGD